MRKKRTPQCSSDLPYRDHAIYDELCSLSQWLDAHPQIINWVFDDLRSEATHDTGRDALSAESVLRIAFLRQRTQFSFEYLAFVLMDSPLYRAFCRLAPNQTPHKPSLQSLVCSITATTYQRIHRAQLKTAREQKIETGRVAAIDSTVTATNIKPPYDSDLLGTSVKEMCHLLEQGLSFTAEPLYQFTHHKKVIKKTAKECSYAKKKEQQKQHYEKLLQLTRKTRKVLLKTRFDLENALKQGDCFDAAPVTQWLSDVDQLLPLVEVVDSQTDRRVFKGEKVPAQEKIVSLYEPHTDIIVKDRRDVQYGHKLNLTQGKSRMILDLVIETGNPADSDRFIPMLERQIDIYDRAPRQATVDGGYASSANLEDAKALGVSDVAFHKKRGLKVEDMVKSPYVYRKLYCFRAGIEAGISWLKRCFGLSVCPCHGEEHFEAWCWAAVVCYNFVILSRYPAPCIA